MARAVTTQHKTIATVAAWIVAFLIFFPILYTIITSFKSETEAIAVALRAAVPADAAPFMPAMEELHRIRRRPGAFPRNFHPVLDRPGIHLAPSRDDPCSEHLRHHDAVTGVHLDVS